MKRPIDSLADIKARFTLPATCSEGQCSRPILARMLCKAHYDERRVARRLPPRIDATTRGLSHFFSKVAQDDAGCWIWQGALTYQGYGQFMLNRKNVRVHRLAYEQIVGTIPEGLVLDHLCRVVACCNPEHLEPVTVQVNTLRGVGPSAIAAARSTCRAGHAYTEASTRMERGRRICRICERLKMRRLRTRDEAAS